MANECAAVRVVLVDDSSIVRERVAAHLSALDRVEVVGQAGDGPAGAALIHALRPDVLVLDIDLPGQSGIELLEATRRQGHSPLIIMLTNYDHPMLREACAELGADFFFHKATEFERVLDICEDLAGRGGRSHQS